MDISARCEMAIDVLRRTDDGDDLKPADLCLVEGAVNGFLNDEGWKLFAELHSTVVAGQYTRGWFHDIEHLTINRLGYIFWNGQEVEHYSLPWAYTEAGKERALVLAERCRRLEARKEGEKHHG